MLVKLCGLWIKKLMSGKDIRRITYALFATMALVIVAKESPRSSAIPSKALNQGLPTVIDDCNITRIKEISTRLLDSVTGAKTPGSGSAISFRNGGYQVSYDEEGEISRSRVGDRVRMCLVTIPHPCPPGDDRGFRYTTTNLRTGEQWTLPDSQHACGGA
jgi:hypothetical protein